MKEIGGICRIAQCYHTHVPPFLNGLVNRFQAPLAFRPSPLVRVRGLLQADRTFAVALPEAERLAGLNRRFATVVPAAVARACRVAAILGDAALVYCANGAAASRVRAQAKGVARALATEDAPVVSLKVKVRADWSLPERPEKRDMPAAALGAFRDLDRHLPEGALKDAVERLLARRKTR